MSRHNRQRRSTVIDPSSLVLREIQAPDTGMVNQDNQYQRAYMLGECSVLVTKECGEWHVSIAHHSRYPSWDEVAEARYRTVPDGVTMAMLLPPRAAYVNIHQFCLQMIQIYQEDKPEFYV